MNVPFSTYNSYERSNYKQPWLPMKFVRDLLPALVGRGNPPIQDREVLALAGAPASDSMTSLVSASFGGASNVRSAALPVSFASLHLVRDLPVYHATPAQRGFSMSLAQATGQFTARPPALDGSQTAFAFYATDDSMAPWRRPGELVMVQPARQAAPGCHVIVRLRSANVWLLRLLVGRTAEALTLSQYRPDATEQFPSDDVAEVLRVIEWPEALGFQ